MSHAAKPKFVWLVIRHYTPNAAHAQGAMAYFTEKEAVAAAKQYNQFRPNDGPPAYVLPFIRNAMAEEHEACTFCQECGHNTYI